MSSSSSDEEDELPPPLEDVSKELSKLGVKDSNSAYEVKPKPKKPPASKGIRRGFFDAPRKKGGKASSTTAGASAGKKKSNSSSSSSSSGSSSKDEDVVELKGKSGQKGNKVPDWMKIDPSSDQAKLMQMKDKIVDAMKPTPDMMQNVMKDADLMSGFDDPEVMQAVGDIAKDPKNINKYKNNPKVMAFYQNMAKTMANRFDQLAAEQDTHQQKHPNPPQKAQQQPSSRSTGSTENQRGSIEDKLLFTNKSEASPKSNEEFKPLIEEL